MLFALFNDSEQDLWSDDAFCSAFCLFCFICFHVDLSSVRSLVKAGKIVY